MGNHAQQAYDIYIRATQIEVEADDPASLRMAKKEISIAQADIRAVKKALTDEQREVRAEFQEQSRRLTASGQYSSTAAGALLGRNGRRAISAARTSSRNSLTKRKNEAMAAFDQEKAYIDRLIMALSRTKLEIDRMLGSAK